MIETDVSERTVGAAHKEHVGGERDGGNNGREAKQWAKAD